MWCLKKWKKKKPGLGACHKTYFKSLFLSLLFPIVTIDQCSSITSQHLALFSSIGTLGRRRHHHHHHCHHHHSHYCPQCGMGPRYPKYQRFFLARGGRKIFRIASAAKCLQRSVSSKDARKGFSRGSQQKHDWHRKPRKKKPLAPRVFNWRALNICLFSRKHFFLLVSYYNWEWKVFSVLQTCFYY